MAVIVKVVTFLLNVLQIMYEPESASPLDAHPNIMLIPVSSFLLYCLAFYLEHHFTFIFRFSIWPALVIIYSNFKRFLGCVSIASVISIIFSTSFTTSVLVYLLLALFFSGLGLIQNRNSIAMKRSNSYSHLQVQVDVPRVNAFAIDVQALPV